MIKSATLFTQKERLHVPRPLIDTLCRQMPIQDHYGDDLFSGYFADYAGMAAKYQPASILEIGVRFGYTAICMMWGKRQADPEAEVFYRGIDDESYHPCLLQANNNFRASVPWANAQAIYYNSITQGIPPECRNRAWSFIHIDGNHDYHGVTNDLERTWNLAANGGIILLDDAMDIPENPIAQAIKDFVRRVDDNQWSIEIQWHPNERHHCYIRKCKIG